MEKDSPSVPALAVPQDLSQQVRYLPAIAVAIATAGGRNCFRLFESHMATKNSHIKREFSIAEEVGFEPT